VNGLSEKKERLKGLIEHWAHHNDEHRDRFLEEAEEAEKLGLSEAAAEMRSAAGKADEVSAHLRKALEHLRGG
jgi:hypothetical protein